MASRLRPIFAGWSLCLEADLLPDEDDVDAAEQLLVDPQDLPDLAVLPIGGLRTGIAAPAGVSISTHVWGSCCRAA